VLKTANQNARTTGNLLYAVCQKVCREPQHGHSAKNLFAECLEPNTRQTRGTRHNPYLPSAGARQTNGTRQNMDMPSASERAHGKAGTCSSCATAVTSVCFAECFPFGTRQNEILSSVFSRHSAKSSFTKKNCGRWGNRARDLPHTKNPPLPSRRSLFSVQLGLRFLKLYI